MGLFLADNIHDLIAIIITAIILVIAYLKWKVGYWQRLGLYVPSEPSIIFGNSKDLLLGRTSFGENIQKFYFQLKAKGVKHGGVYIGPARVYIPVEVELIKAIIQKDFGHFINHGNYMNEENDPLTGHLFNLKDTKWRNMRIKMTPTFTSGKMKMMFHTVAKCASSLKDVLAVPNQNPHDIKDILGRYTTDIIGSCAFGLECNSLKNPEADFRRYGKKIMENNFWENLNVILEFVLPHKFLDFIKHKQTKSEVENFFMKAITDTVEYRETNNIYRKDFLHLLLQLKNRGTVSDDENIKSVDGEGEKALTMNELAAQAFVFFIAGFETSSTAMTFALYELARNPKLQDKLRMEIFHVTAKYNNEITYGAITEMTYMDKVLNESLRKYPPAAILLRKCNKDYRVPDTSITIKKGTDLMIPIWGLHMDPEFWPDPEKFDPERFSDEEKSKRPAMAWIPFGEGPRLCIGSRFALMQAKVGLTEILRNFKVGLNEKTRVPIEMEKTNFMTSAEGGVWLDVTPL